jgi:predicted dienelactone hydrolase
MEAPQLYNRSMDSTPRRLAGFFAGALASLAMLACTPALAYNHTQVVSPIPLGRFAVACSNVSQDTSRIAPGLSASDYWEGRGHYISEILTSPLTAIQFNVRVPDRRNLYQANYNRDVPYVAIVCHPTPRTNTDPDYALPGGVGVVPHMVPPGGSPKLITAGEYAATAGIPVTGDPAAPAKLPTVVFSHGLTGSPISKGYIDATVQLAAQGFVVVAPFHGDPRFSLVRIEDISDFLFLVANFGQVVELMLMRPVSVTATLDQLLAHPGYAPAIDRDRIGGFGASMGGEAMTLLLGAQLTTTPGGHCEENPAVADTRIRAVVGYVPYAGYSFLPAFCNGQQGAALVTRPYLAISGTADTTAPADMMEQALNRFQGTRYFVELENGQHELRPEDVGDLFTWMVTFFDAYLDVHADPGAMGRLIKMKGVTGGRDDALTIDVHKPFPLASNELLLRELYNPIINHYFMTADPAEIARILRGDNGTGWVETGESFKAWSQPPGDAPGAAPVCLFYGKYRSGPASHFYTASAAECELTKSNRGWYYVGSPFYAIPAANGECPTGYLGVNRAYNNGFVRNDDNHRYSTSDSTIRDMERAGWTAENTVMCTRP